MPIVRLLELDWRRALPGVAVIFIGITLALYFENWNEARKKRALGQQLLVKMVDNLVVLYSADPKKRKGLSRNVARNSSSRSFRFPPGGGFISWILTGTSLRLGRKADSIPYWIDQLGVVNSAKYRRPR